MIHDNMACGKQHLDGNENRAWVRGSGEGNGRALVPIFGGVIRTSLSENVTCEQM